MRDIPSDATLEYSIDSSDGCGVWLFVRRPKAFAERMATLDDTRFQGSMSLTQHEREISLFATDCNMIMYQLRLQNARLDPAVKERIAETRKAFETAFSEAGLSPIYIEQIENGYWPEAYAAERYSEPWYIITTKYGRLKLGWRKRVIQLEWGDAPVLAAQGDIFTDSTTTHGECYVHAHGYVDLAVRLGILRARAESVA